MIDLNEYMKQFYTGKRNASIKSMKFLMDCYGNFEKNMKFIHITGTNGKGSCSEILSNILCKQGYKVGKFLSPHLIKYNERISINGAQISDGEMICIIEELQPKMDRYFELYGEKVSLFELLTMVAFIYFYRNNVDFVVLEVGLGGEYDATNVITKPLVSIISSVGFDHMRLLGNTLAQIASEKSGIIKADSDTVVFEQTEDINNVFKNKCKDLNNQIHLIKETDIKNYKLENGLQFFDFKDFENLSINLKGYVQVKNATLCVESIKILEEKGFYVSDESLREGLSTVIHKARMEMLCINPIVIFDGAHNKPAIENLINTIDRYYPNKKRVYIISILKRKDYKGILQILAQDKLASFIVTSGDESDTFVTGDELYNCLTGFVCQEKVTAMDLREAIRLIKGQNDNHVNFITGSFHTYKTVTEELK